MKMKPAWPEDASILSRWTYIYMIPLLVKGANKKGIVIYEEEDGVKKERIVEGPGLTPDDLYELPNKMKSENVIEAFEKAFEVSGKNVLKAIWKMGAKDYFIPAAICEFVRIVALSVSTLLLKEVLATLESYPNQVIPSDVIVRHGYAPAIGYFVLLIVMALSKHRHSDFATSGGIVVRAAISSAVYRHALLLSPEGKENLTSGEVTNLIATDAQKLFEVTQEINLTWSCPMAIVLVTILLLWIFGPISLIGILCLMLCTPLINEIANRMIKARSKRAALSDERIEITSAMLQGMKVTKVSKTHNFCISERCLYIVITSYRYSLLFS